MRSEVTMGLISLEDFRKLLRGECFGRARRAHRQGSLEHRRVSFGGCLGDSSELGGEAAARQLEVVQGPLVLRCAERRARVRYGVVQAVAARAV